MENPNPPEGPSGSGTGKVGPELDARLKEEVAPGLHLLRRLGRSSTSLVYLARDPALKRLVAIKVLSPLIAQNPKARFRFEREAQAAAGIVHRNVVTIHQVGTLSDGIPYLVMQYVKGRSLADRLRAEGRLEQREVKSILADVADALAAAHRRRIVHRDVKPSNVLYEEETGQVYLTDFGIAAILASGEDEPRRVTTAGHVIADMRYVSPEQLQGEELTERADIYSLGVLGFELLTSESPYGVSAARDLAAAHLRSQPRRLSEIREDADAELEDLLTRCLAKNPAYRPSAVDVVRRLAGRSVEAPDSLEPQHGGSPPAEGSLADVGAPDVASPRVPMQVAPRGAPEPSASGTARLGPVTERTAGAGRAGAAGRTRLFLLGSLELVAPDGRRLLSVLAQPKRVALMAYLAVGGDLGFKRRDSLLGVFWAELDQEHARHALRQAVYVLRRALGTDVLVSRGDEEIGLSGEVVWCDAIAFERAAAAGHVEEALDLYQGDLLPGFFLADAPEFERWLESERERLRELASDGAWAVARIREEEGNPTGAAHWARRAFELAPFDEGALRRLIELLDRLGDRAGAVRAYEQFARTLHEEYRTEPSPETQRLIRRVRERG
ncbi:MAG: protein kinase [Gemmatimonadota bacterium]